MDLRASDTAAHAAHRTAFFESHFGAQIVTRGLKHGNTPFGLSGANSVALLRRERDFVLPTGA